jgi:hypothetical protein
MRKILFLVSLVAWCGWTGVANALITSTEHFNTKTLGALNGQAGALQQWAGSWSAVESATKLAKVEDGTLVPTSDGLAKHLHVYGSSQTMSVYRRFLGGQEAGEDILHYSFDIRIVNSALTSDLSIALGEDGGDANKVHLQFQADGSINRFVTSAVRPELGYWNGTVPTSESGLPTLPDAADSFVKFEIYANKATKKFDAYYAGIQIANNLAWRAETGTSPLNRVLFQGGLSGSVDPAAGGVYLDNFYLEGVVPEPATCLLLGLGTLFLGRRRR